MLIYTSEMWRWLLFYRSILTNLQNNKLKISSFIMVSTGTILKVSENWLRWAQKCNDYFMSLYVKIVDLG